jgi:predicted NBD/HSP70 family sugar kinase
VKVLTVDIGGTTVKILASGQHEPRKCPSGKTLTPERMVAGVKELAQDWKYDVVSIGYPGLVHDGRVASDPHNLAPGWIGFDFEAAFGCPVRILNDAAMQALGSYRGGQMLFVGLGTGMGSAIVAHGVVIPLEVGHLSYSEGTYEDYVGSRGLERFGEERWRKHVEHGVARLVSALHPDDVVIGGGNVKRLKDLPRGCRRGDNAKAFLGGFRLWDESGHDWGGSIARSKERGTPRGRGI